MQGCDVSCAHCEIRFLTHPRNVGRVDLRCPFGCREAHRRLRSRQRSVAYYQTAAGREKKRHLNTARKRRSAPLHDSSPQNSSPLPPPAVEPVPDILPEAPAELRLEGIVLDESTLTNSRLLPHARIVVNLIECLQLDRRQFLALLLAALRQRSIATRKRADYVWSYLHEHPP